MVLLPGLVSAAISINRTRLIVTQQEREASAQILNEGTQPVLIQTWVDTGDAQRQVEQIKAPFLVDPPVFRLDPGQSRQVRVLMVWPIEQLPQERESVFWFNVLEVPPKAESQQASNHLQISFRTRLKIFFRPQSVVQQLAGDVQHLTFMLRRDASGNAALSIHNPSPQYWSFDVLEVIAPDGTRVPLPPRMVAPGQSVEHPLNRSISQANWRVHFSTIDDLGVVHDEEKTLLPE
ncbi:hypothetical protein AXE65_02670 [Ventosimonas gracilis]|uniref:Fimbrial chaperone protein n=2 Tax=Ventosimonas gracilis TaxID=1680762 RepID=A0A139SU83_9GAMM|nr:hypothetical protein AXE65_02670 [Ventosimonas gracilis]